MLLLLCKLVAVPVQYKGARTIVAGAWDAIDKLRKLVQGLWWSNMDFRKVRGNDVDFMSWQHEAVIQIRLGSAICKNRVLQTSGKVRISHMARICR